jgi:arabinogalactan endo-1,4-beta-galactosidase
VLYVIPQSCANISAPGTAGTTNCGYEQQWQLVDSGEGFYQLLNRNSGKLLDISGASGDDGAVSIQWPSNAGYNQMRQIVKN